MFILFLVPKLALAASEDLLKQVQIEMDNQQDIINKYKLVVCHQYEELEQPNANTLRLVDESNNHHQFLVHEIMLLVCFIPLHVVLIN